MNNLLLSTITMCTDAVRSINDHEPREMALTAVIFGVCMLRCTAALRLVL